jgi:hypothetical protein
VAPEVVVTDFQDAYNRVVDLVEARYGVDVEIADVLDPNTGDFDGATIKLDYDQDLDIALFVLVHLFGHTVQWNVSEEFREIGKQTAPGKTDEELARILDYERDATRYSLTLLHEADVLDLDQWVTDWWRADWEFLAHFYKTGERLDPRSLLKPGGGPPLTPLAIPEFQPHHWVSRWSF